MGWQRSKGKDGKQYQILELASAHEMTTLTPSAANSDHDQAGVLEGDVPNRGKGWFGPGGNGETSNRKMVKGAIELFKRNRVWADGLSTMRTAQEDMPTVTGVKSLRRKRQWGASGIEVDMDRVRTGRLDTAWRCYRRQVSTGTRIIKVVVDMCCNWMVTGKQYIWTGIAATALIDTLEASGYRVELEAVCAGTRTYGTRGYAIRVPLKAADEPLDIERVLLWTAHPAAFRVYTFQALLANQLEVEPSLGIPRPAAEAVAAIYGDRFGLGPEFEALCVPRLHSPKAAQDWILSVVKAYGLLDT